MFGRDHDGTGSSETLSRKNLRITSERLKFQRISAWVGKKHRGLFPHLPLKADVRFDTEFRASRMQPLRQCFPLHHIKDYAEMRYRHSVAVNRIVDRTRDHFGVKMCDKLMPIKVKIDPMFR